MTTLEAIKKANQLRPNKIDDETKAYWLSVIDGDIAEMMDKEVYLQILFPQDQELLMPAPHDDIYQLYLISKIDFYNEDERYADDVATYMIAFEDACAWWRRNHEPKNVKCFEVM